MAVRLTTEKEKTSYQETKIGPIWIRRSRQELEREKDKTLPRTLLV
jgi:hypothetical protein